MFKTAYLALLVAVLACHGAVAGVSDRVTFQVSGAVIVWGDDAIATSFVIQPEDRAPEDFVSHDAHIVQTGALIPVGSAPSAPLSHAGGSFYVASNTAFNIDAQMQGRASAAAQDAAFGLTVSLGGPSAQAPHKDGLSGGIDRSVTRLADLKSRRTIYRGTRRTAAQRGSIADQSVRFDMSLKSTAETVSALPPIAVTVYIP